MHKLIENLLWKSRFIVILAVIFSFAGSVILFIIAIIVAVMAYVWYVRSKLFPDFAFIGPKKVNGEHVFSS